MMLKNDILFLTVKGIIVLFQSVMACIWMYLTQIQQIQQIQQMAQIFNVGVRTEQMHKNLNLLNPNYEFLNT